MNRLRIRPEGVVSKKDVGARSTASSSRICGGGDFVVVWLSGRTVVGCVVLGLVSAVWTVQVVEAAQMPRHRVQQPNLLGWSGGGFVVGPERGWGVVVGCVRRLDLEFACQFWVMQGRDGAYAEGDGGVDGGALSTPTVVWYLFRTEFGASPQTLVRA